jgi:phage gp36-like protein
MSYASQADMEDRFGATELAQRTDRTNGAVIDTVVLGRALADADSEIDGYLATRYTLPLPSTPPVVNRLACEIARYRLFDDGVPETVRVRYQDAVSLLKRLSSGEVQLAGISPVVVAGGTGNAVATRTAPKQFDGISLGVY